MVGGAPGGDDAFAMAMVKITGKNIQWLYLLSDLSVLLLSLSYIPVRRIFYSLLTVILSGQIIGLVVKLPQLFGKKAPEAEACGQRKTPAANAAGVFFIGPCGSCGSRPRRYG